MRAALRILTHGWLGANYATGITLDDALHAHLAADSGLVALVDTRIYCQQVPLEAALPAVAYVRVSTGLVHHRSNQRSGLKRPRFQFDAWAGSPATARELAEALEAALGQFKGTFNAIDTYEVDEDGDLVTTHNGVTILVDRTTSLRVDSTQVQDEGDIFEEEPGRWRARMDAFVWHN